MRVLPTLAGRVNLGSWSVSPNGVPITFTLKQGGSVVKTIQTHLDAAGNYAIALDTWDTYDIVLRAPHWLTAKVSGARCYRIWAPASRGPT